MEVPSPPSSGIAPNGLSSAAPFQTIEPERVLDHLVAICLVALGATREELQQSGNLLHSSRHAETVARCSRFSNDNQNVLYIQKDIATSSAVDSGSDVAGMWLCICARTEPDQGTALLLIANFASLRSFLNVLLYTNAGDFVVGHNSRVSRPTKISTAYRPDPIAHIANIHHKPARSCCT